MVAGLIINVTSLCQSRFWDSTDTDKSKAKMEHSGRCCTAGHHFPKMRRQVHVGGGIRLGLWSYCAAVRYLKALVTV